MLDVFAERRGVEVVDKEVLVTWLLIPLNHAWKQIPHSKHRPLDFYSMSNDEQPLEETKQ